MSPTTALPSVDPALPWEAPGVLVGPAAGGKVDVLSLDSAALGAFIASLGERPYRAKQLYAWLHQRLAARFEDMSDLPKGLRARLAETAMISAPVVEQVRQSADGTRKYQLTTVDGHTIESVYIPDASGPGKNALCISSQVGCAMGCTFCATAALKLTRHLAGGEIAGQLYAVLRDLAAHVPHEAPLARAGYDVEAGDEAGDDGSADREELRGRPRRRIQNLVYMGMGEPLHNYDGVVGSVAIITSEAGQGYSPRRLTVSTSGLVPQIAKLGRDTDVNLAISLNGSTDAGRTAVMPVNKRWDLAALLDACRDFPLDARRRITFEYVLLAGENDSDDDAHRVAALLAGMRSKVNLIPFNAHPLSPFARPSDERVESFRAILDRAHLSCFVRTTRGLDIDAACGMLGAKKLEKARGSLPVLGS